MLEEIDDHFGEVVFGILIFHSAYVYERITIANILRREQMWYSERMNTLLSGDFDGSFWNFYASDELPPAELITAVSLVAITDLDSSSCVMTHSTKDGREWEAIAGHVEPGESVVEAVAREAREEAGLVDIQDLNLFGLIELHNVNPDTAYPPLSYIPVYMCRSDQTDFAPEAPDVDTAEVVSLAELNRRGTPYETAQHTRDILGIVLSAARAQLTTVK